MFDTEGRILQNISVQTTCVLFQDFFVKSRGLFVMSTRVRKSCCTYTWCRNSCIGILTRMYTMMEEHVHTMSTFDRCSCHKASKQRPVTAHLLTSTLTYVELQLGCCLRQLAVEGEKGEDGDEVGGELVLLQPLLHRVKQWGRENLQQSLKET